MSEQNGDSTVSSILEGMPDEALAVLVRGLVTEVADGGILELQDRGRTFLRRFLNRNAIFAANVQQDGRINIPQAEREKLNLEGGELIQVAIVPLEETDE